MLFRILSGEGGVTPDSGVLVHLERTGCGIGAEFARDHDPKCVRKEDIHKDEPLPGTVDGANGDALRQTEPYAGNLILSED